MSEPLRRTDPEVLKAYASGAREKLADLSFQKALLDLRQKWFGELMLDNLSQDRINELRSMLKALDALPQRLASMAQDDQVRGFNVRRV